MVRKKKSENRGFIRYAIVLLVFLFAILLLKKDNLLTWIRAAFTTAQQKAEIEQLTKENEALDRKVMDLSQNRDSLETFARENYNFTQKGDDVFIIE